MNCNCWPLFLRCVSTASKLPPAAPLSGISHAIVCTVWDQELEQTKIASLLFSPTAMALGSSAIGKVSGQNCFRTLYASLGQIHLGLPKRFHVIMSHP